MKNSDNYNYNILFLEEKFLPRVVWLEAEDFEEAREKSEKCFNEIKGINQWQIYLNTLAQLGFQRYLKQRNPKLTINQDNRNQVFDNICYLTIDKFSFCLIILDDLADEDVPIPTNLITSSQKAAHFYVLLEICEEQEQLNIHGFFRHDQLSKHLQQELEYLSLDSYELSLPLFDKELNNLLLYTRFLSPSAIIKPESPKQNVLVNIRGWLKGVFEETWQATELIFNGSLNNFAWGNVRSSQELNAFPLSRTKLVDFGILLQDQPIALIVSVKEENEEIGVIVKIKPLQEEFLPSDLKLKVTLNPNTESESQEAFAKTFDEVIQIEFSSAPGKQFQVEVSYQDTIITEAFVL